jgi:hypothetical protein
MTYEDAWNEMYEWLKKGKGYLEEREAYFADRDDDYGLAEYQRIRGKLEGIKICMGHMEESERVYDLTEVDDNGNG